MVGLLLLCPHDGVSKTFTVASIQFNPRFANTADNVNDLAELFSRAAKNGAKVIVAPEMATSGYMYQDRKEISPFVETIPGPTTDRFADIANRHNCYLVWGMAEVDWETKLYYNASVIVGPGDVLEKYRKIQLWETDMHWAAWGDGETPICGTEWGNLSLAICQGANVFELFRIAMLKGSDLVCFSTNSSGQTVGTLQARAIENGLYVVSANRSDEEKGFNMTGCSAVWSPTGEKLAEAARDTEEIIYADIDTSLYEHKEAIKAQRKPELYLELMLNIAPWNYRATKKEDAKQVYAVALQYEPARGRKDMNKEKVSALLRNSILDLRVPSGSGLLIVLPEYSLTGRVAVDTVRKVAERVDGSTLKYAREISLKYDAYVVYGLIEKAGKGFYNTAVMVRPNGKKYEYVRKVHLNEYDQQWALPGDEFRVFDTSDLGRVGILVGSDAYFPEAGGILAVKRADIVAIPSSWHGEVAGNGNIAIDAKVNPHAARGGMVLWDSLAWNFLYYTVVANFVGTSNAYLGKSGIYSLDPIYGLESPALAKSTDEEAVAGSFWTIHGGDVNHWITQELYINSRRHGAVYYPLIRR